MANMLVNILKTGEEKFEKIKKQLNEQGEKENNIKKEVSSLILKLDKPL